MGIIQDVTHNLRCLRRRCVARRIPLRFCVGANNPLQSHRLIPLAVAGTLLLGLQGLEGRAASDEPFVLGGLVFDGSQVFDPKSFLPRYRHLLGQSVTREQLQKMVDAIADQYRNAGYVLAQVALAAQRPRFGIVRVRVTEGHIERVRISGDAGDEALIRGYLEKASAARPLHRRELERYLLLVNDLPGVSTRYKIRPLDHLGAYELIAIVKPKKRRFSLGVDNRGNERLGPLRGHLSADWYSLFRRQEHVGLRLWTAGDSKELRSIYAASAWPVGSEGQHLLVSGSYADVEPGGDLQDTETEITAERFMLGYEFSAMRRRGRSLALRGRLGMYNSDVAQNGSRVREDKLRTVKLAGDYIRSNKKSALRGFLQITKGIDGLGSGKFTAPGGSNPDRDLDFLKSEMELTYVTELRPTVSLLLQLMGQYTRDRLPFSEYFVFGGAHTGRGFAPAELSGDRGASLKMELRYHTRLRLGPLSPKQLYAFYDVGALWQRLSNRGWERESAASSGAGVRFELKKSLNGYLEIAKPLTRASAEHGDDFRLFARLEFRF